MHEQPTLQSRSRRRMGSTRANRSLFRANVASTPVSQHSISSGPEVRLWAHHFDERRQADLDRWR
jgi:hypothetical protein